MTVECPFEKDGVLEGIRKLTKDDGLMAQLVGEVRRSNRLAKHNNKWLKTVTYLFAMAVVLLLAVGLLAWEIFGDVVVVEQNMGKSVQKQDELIGDFAEMVKTQRETKTAVDEVKKDQDEKPKVELVPEEDPEKAKSAPIKVRITSPKKPPKGDKPHPPAPTQTAVEVPLPVKDAQAVEKK